DSQFPEFAFTGRSNVGKSILINFLTHRKKLAKTSTTPGKTQLINHFLINDSWYLVDLPGYGYAKVSKKNRDLFGSLIEEYIMGRKNLLNLFVLIDSNIPPQKNDLDFINWLGFNNIPFSLVFTKADKSTRRSVQLNLKNFRTEMLKTWETMPPEFLSSSRKKTGGQEILEYIEKLILEQKRFS
ncbi:MAG: YihA family ribosome biogenesis GTP-binding protein, partial [Bacteroidales bacterium]|nr:YihA family ribosome biogenesis GTP-binding protein [Bacteroidales bacterium]